MTAPATIFAEASGSGTAAIAVVRLSGAGTEAALRALTGRSPPPPRRLSLRRLRDPADGEPLDDALVAWFPGPASFTGEDCAELHLHGGRAVRAAVIAALAGLADLRPARPGEFTRRAFRNGRLDLAAVEGLADLIEAETRAQHRQALRQLDGVLGRQVEAWRVDLLDALAGIEAVLDFADEGDVAETASIAAALARAAGVGREVVAALARGRGGERLREGLTVVLAGPPNAGKSTLLNAIARRDVALVASTPGTTRDAIEVRLDLGGWPVTLVDTAGLRATDDPVEAAGIARARARAAAADLVLDLTAPDAPSPDASPPPASLPADDGPPRWRVRAKSDLDGGNVEDVRAGRRAVDDGAGGGTALAVSAATGEGLPALLAAIEGFAARDLGGGALLTRERHRAAMARCADALARAVVPRADLELAAEDLRLALRALGEITGRVGVDDMLDRLFAGFCIGK